MNAKLVLPTIETCPWRESGEGSPGCRLVSSLLGTAAAPVSDEACLACCESFPPSPRQLNPIVAGLLFDSARRVLAAGGTTQCSPEKAQEVKRQAELSLRIIHPARMTMTVARTAGRCCWLGEPIPYDTPHLASGGPASTMCPPERDNETLYDCRHPHHDQTTPANCRMCRDWTKHPSVSRLLSLEELIPLPGRVCGPKVLRWAVGVTTSPRRDPTLEVCLDSVVRAGWGEPRLFLDGTARLPARYSHLPVAWREDPIGAWPAWYMALGELILQSPDADAYVLLQDDVVLFDRESLRDYLERALWPGDRPGLVPLFYTGLDKGGGWFEARGAWHFSAQGFIFPPGVARALLSDSDVSRSWLAASFPRHIPIPEMLSEWVSRRGIDVWYANPSLLQHIGNTSTIWMDAGIQGGRRAPWFSGSVETEFSIEESLADFPEQAFVCSSESYVDRVNKGRRRMRDSTVVIAGLCRDVRVYLPRTAARIERLGEMFGDYRVVLFENDSADATREFLSDWQNQNPRVDAMSETTGVPRYPQTRSLERAGWLARCRNRYRERLLEKYADFDYVIVADMDLAGGWSYEGVAHTFGGAEWDFVGSYGIQRRLDRGTDKPPYSHIDVWAFRPARGTPARKLINHNELDLKRGDPLLSVESCFGGLGVYRMASMSAAEYGGADCEHVVLHNQLRRAGLDRLYLNPSQIVLYSPL